MQNEAAVSLANLRTAIYNRSMPVAVERPPNAFIRQLPKAELHLHLEGAVTPNSLLELRRRRGNTTTLAETEALYRYSDFPSFLMAFKEVSSHLREPDDYEFVTYRLMQQLKEENVLHAEVYVAVGVCLFRKQDFAAIFEGLERGRARGARDFGVSLLWIFDATRHFGVEAAQSVFELAVRYRDRHVVGVGIGGDEQKAPPELFRGVYAYAEDHGLRLTAHAGETGRVVADEAAPCAGRGIGDRTVAVADIAAGPRHEQPAELVPFEHRPRQCALGVDLIAPHRLDRQRDGGEFELRAVLAN